MSEGFTTSLIKHNYATKEEFDAESTILEDLDLDIIDTSELYEVVLDTPEYAIYKPLSKEGFMYLAGGTRWLHSYDYYNNDRKVGYDDVSENNWKLTNWDKYYVIFDKNNPKKKWTFRDGYSDIYAPSDARYSCATWVADNGDVDMWKWFIDKKFPYISTNLDKKVGHKLLAGKKVYNYPADINMTWNAKQGSDITSIKFEKGTTKIRANSLQGLDKVTEVNIPEGVTAIGNRAFAWCGALQKVTLPSTLKTLGNEVFLSCTSLTTINMPKNLSKVGEGVFQNTQINQSLPLPEKVTEIPNGWYSHNQEITIPAQVKVIGAGAFAGNTVTKNLVIPPSVSTIKVSAFSDSAVTYVYIPSSVTTIEGPLFTHSYTYSGYYGEAGHINRNNIVVDCEASSKPAGWDDLWDVYKSQFNGWYDNNEDRYTYFRVTVNWGVSAPKREAVKNVEVKEDLDIEMAVKDLCGYKLSEKEMGEIASLHFDRKYPEDINALFSRYISGDGQWYLFRVKDNDDFSREYTRKYPYILIFQGFEDIGPECFYDRLPTGVSAGRLSNDYINELDIPEDKIPELDLKNTSINEELDFEDCEIPGQLDDEQCEKLLNLLVSLPEMAENDKDNWHKVCSDWITNIWMSDDTPSKGKLESYINSLSDPSIKHILRVWASTKNGYNYLIGRFTEEGVSKMLDSDSGYYDDGRIEGEKDICVTNEFVRNYLELNPEGSRSEFNNKIVEDVEFDDVDIPHEYKDDHWIVFKPVNTEEFLVLAYGTNWLENARQNNGEEDWHFTYYNTSPLYIIQNLDTGERWKYNTRENWNSLTTEDSSVWEPETTDDSRYTRRNYIGNHRTAANILSKFILENPNTEGLAKWAMRKWPQGTAELKSIFTSNNILAEINDTIIYKSELWEEMHQLPWWGETVRQKALLKIKKNVHNISFPRNTHILVENAFRAYESINEIILPNSITEIGETAFYDCELAKKLRLPSGIKKIGAGAFNGCKNLGGNLFIPASCTHIGEDAFKYCSFDTIYCEAESKPEGWNDRWDVKRDEYAHKENGGYQWKYTRFNVVWGSKGPVQEDLTFDELSDDNLVQYEDDSWKVYCLYDPRDLSVVSDGTNWEDTVTEEQDGELRWQTWKHRVGYYVFIDKKNNRKYFYDSSDTYQPLKDEQTNAVSGHEWLGYGHYASDCLGGFLLDKKDKGEDVDGLIKWACKKWKSGMVTLAAELLNREDDIEFPDTITYNSKEWKYLQSFNKDRTYDTYSTLKNKIKKVIFPDGMTSIPENACYQFYRLEEVDIPDTVTELEDSCFAECIKLEQINLPEGLEIIGSCALYGSAITSITLPKNLKTIGSSAFAQSKNLTEITIPKSVTYLDDYIFYESPHLRCIYLETNHLPKRRNSWNSKEWFDHRYKYPVKVKNTNQTIRDE